jgi:hypothetical protein
MLKMAEIISKLGNIEELNRFSVQFNAYIKRHAHFKPDNNGKTPNPWKKNMDYGAEYENSPYFGNINEFLKRFPGGIKEWLEWRNKTEKDRFKMYNKMRWASDNNKTIKKLLDKMLELEVIVKDQEASDASLKAINDMVNYWKLLLKKKHRSKQ